MNAQRFYFVMLAIVSILGIGVIAATIAGNAVLVKQSKTLTDLKIENKVLDEQQISLATAKKETQKYAELKKEAQAIVPQDKDQAAAVREIVKIAGESGVKISAITFPASTLGGTATGTSSPPKTTPLTQVQPVKGIAGVYVMPITVQHDSTSPITYANLIDFLGRVEKNRRTAQVASVTIQPTAQNAGKLTFNLIVNVYLKP